MSDLLLTSRFTLLDKPLRAPGHCAVCGATDRPVLDFGANLHQRASVWVLYLCVECVREAFMVVDIATGTKESRELEAGRSLQSALDERNLVGIPREHLDTIISIGSELDGIVDVLVNSDLAGEPDPTRSAGTETPEADSSPKRDAPESPKPGSTFTL